MKPVLYLFDDDVARSWEPFSLTRPSGELLFGAFLLRERAERYWQSPCRGHLSASSLVGFAEPGAPPVLDPVGFAEPDASASSDPGGHENGGTRPSLNPGGHENGGTRPSADPGGRPGEGPVELNEGNVSVFQSSRVALQPKAPYAPMGDEAALFAEAAPATLVLGGHVVGWIIPPGGPPPSPELFSSPRALPDSTTVEVQGELLENVWDLMDRNARQLREDIPRHFPGYAVDEVPGSHILGDGLLSLGSDVTVEPGCVFDVSGGPIRLSHGVVVRAHTRLEGPAFVGPGSVILGGVLSGVSIGPVCKIRGEVESSVILGFTNKAHDGFLGHAYLGRWVNLGAFTTNSDLKNNYGPVRVGTAEGAVDTGLLKVGCFLGDHVKTGIGTVINTGTTVGAGSNLFGGRMPPSYVPPYSWGTGSDLTEYRLEPFLEVAARSMARRGLALDEGMAAVLSRAWESTRHLRSSGG